MLRGGRKQAMKLRRLESAPLLSDEAQAWVVSQSDRIESR
jgi:ribosome assembly protein YihI (activator of Der GTPase)